MTTLLLGLSPHLSAQAAFGPIEGSGSTWTQVIVDQWTADVSAKGMQVTYNGAGSSQGRKNFAWNVTDFGISETPYRGVDELGNVDSAGVREFAYVPIVAGGTAFTYHLEVEGALVRDIRLSGETIAKIFTNSITTWADPAIAADNNGRVFPDLPVVPVVRADGSGTTHALTEWLAAEHQASWQGYSGGTGPTLYYPKKGTRMIAASGSDQVMNTVASAAGNGAIAYVEYSYPFNRGFPVAKVLNAAGFFVEPTQYNVAVALTTAQINEDPTSPLYLTHVLDGVYSNPDPRAYPLSSYSYMIIPTGANDPRMTTAKRQTLVDFIFYSLCEGQGKAGAYGYSPLPLNLVQAGIEQLAQLHGADPAVNIENRDAAHCTNPTFVAADLSRDSLGEVAPPPASCDRSGAGPCLSAGQSMGEPGGSAPRVVLTVPESPYGSLTLSVSSDAPVYLTGLRDVVGDVHAQAMMPTVAVRDTRLDERMSLWELHGQVSPFSSVNGTFGAEYLGWAPGLPSIERTEGSALVAGAGSVVSSSLASPGSLGLSQSALLMEAVVAGRGTVRVDSELRLHAPETVVRGVYSATVTLTLVSS